MPAVDGPRRVGRKRAVRRRGLHDGKQVAFRHAVFLRQSAVRGPARRLRKVVPRAELAFEAEVHLLDRDALTNHPPQQRFVETAGLAVRPGIVVVGHEVEEDQVRLARQHVAVQPEHAEVRPRAADGRVIERERRARVTRPQIGHHPAAVARELRIAGVRAPRQRPAEEHDGHRFAGLRPPVERREGGLPCTRKQRPTGKARKGQPHDPETRHLFSPVLGTL